MTTEKLDEVLKEQNVELDEHQKSRLLDLFERFEESPFHWGDYIIVVENGMPKINVTFTFS